jgi:hypothetical protein
MVGLAPRDEQAQVVVRRQPSLVVAALSRSYTPRRRPPADVYTNQGDTLAYVCELEGDTMTIWMGEKGSPAVYSGTFSADGNTIGRGTLARLPPER